MNKREVSFCKQVLVLSRRIGYRTLKHQANRLLFLCIAWCVCVAASLNLFSNSVHSALQQDISRFLGAPLVISSNTQIPNHLIERKNIQLVNTHTLTTGAIAEKQYQSVSVKGVSAKYPLNGKLIVDFGKGERAARGEQLKPGHAWLDEQAFNMLNINLGDSIQIGKQTLAVTGKISFEPDRLTQWQHTLPRVMVSLDTLQQSGTLDDHQGVDYRTLISGNTSDLNQLEAQLSSLIPHNYHVLKPEAGHHPFARLSLRAKRMLNLVVLFMLLICGSAAAILADYSVLHAAVPSAVLRCIGLHRHAMSAALCLQLLVLASAASLAGCFLAWLLQPFLYPLMEPHLYLEPRQLRFREFFAPISIGPVMVVAFVLPRLHKLGSVPVAGILRNPDTPKSSSKKTPYLSVICAAAVACGMLWVNTDNASLTAMLVAAVSLLILLAICFGWGLSKLSSQAHHVLRGPAKIAVRAIGRSPKRHITPLVSIGITVMALLLTATLRGSFIDTLQVQRLEADGNYIFSGLLPQEKPAFSQTLNRHNAELKGLYPTVSARLVTINGEAIDKALSKQSETREEIRSNVRLSWAEEKPNNNTLIAGQWPAIGSGEVSVEEEVMSDLGLQLGDDLGFQIGSKLLTARITSKRKYNGSASSMMFWFMFAPDTLVEYDYRYMGGFLLRHNGIQTLEALATDFPQLRITNLEHQMSKVRTIMLAITRLMNTILGLLLCGALMLVIASSFTGASQHKKLLLLLRTFGTSHKQCYLIGIIQQLSLAVVSCLVGILGAQAIAGLMFKQLFQLPYIPSWGLILALSGAVSALFVTLSCFTVFQHLKQPTHASLR